MFQHASRIAIRGALIFAIIGTLGATALAYYWDGFGDGFYLLLFFWVPFIGMVGFGAGFILFFIVGLIRFRS